MSAYIRTVKTLSGATAVQVVFHEYSGKKSMEHVGSARNEHELALLTAQAQQIVDGGQLSLDFGFAPADTPLRGSGSVDNPLPVSGQSAGYLLDCIDSCYKKLAIDVAVNHDQVFADLVRARIINPGSSH